MAKNGYTVFTILKNRTCILNVVPKQAPRYNFHTPYLYTYVVQLSYQLHVKRFSVSLLYWSVCFQHKSVQSGANFSRCQRDWKFIDAVVKRQLLGWCYPLPLVFRILPKMKRVIWWTNNILKYFEIKMAIS